MRADRRLRLDRRFWFGAVLVAGLVGLAGPVGAQPTAAALAFRQGPAVGGPAVGETPAGYRTIMATLVSGTGAALGGASALAVVVLAASSGLGTDGGSVGSDVMLVTLGAVGSTAGAALAVYVLGQDEADYRGILPSPDLRRSDAGAALVGAAAGLLPGLGAALLIQQVLPSDADPFLSYLSVPVAQGLGAAVAITLHR